MVLKKEKNVEIWTNFCQIFNIASSSLIKKFYYIMLSTLKMTQVLILYFKFWGVEQNLISNKWLMVLANVLIKDWTINPYIHGIFLLF